MVIVDNTLPRNNWPKGVVSSTYPGRDGRIRVADIETNRGIMRRPVTKIVKLATESVAAST